MKITTMLVVILVISLSLALPSQVSATTQYASVIGIKEARISAEPKVITADGMSTSNITVELLNEKNEPAVGAVLPVTLSTTAGKFNESGTKTVSGVLNPETASFSATLISTENPVCAKITANVGNLYFASTSVSFGGHGDYTIHLYNGMNLISVPLMPDNNSAANITEQIKEELSEVSYYNATTGEWETGIWVTGKWTGIEKLEVQKGYWFKMNADADLTITGYDMVPGPGVLPTLKLEKGWNMVGYYCVPPEKEMRAEEYFEGIEVLYPLWGFKAGAWTSVYKDTALKSGEGYYVYVKEEGEITPKSL